MVLQQSVDHVGLPMWLPGTCDKGSHILLRGSHSLGTEDLPEEQVWETSYGQVLGLRVPRPIFEMALRLNVHHLEDLVTEAGTATRGAAAYPVGVGITKPAFKSYRAWVTTHSSYLRHLRATPAPLWTSGPEKWAPKVPNIPSVTVVGGRGAKREKTRTVPVGDSLQEIDEDLYQSLGDLMASLPRICALSWGSPPILDVRLHKALTYFMEIRTHYGAPL